MEILLREVLLAAEERVPLLTVELAREVLLAAEEREVLLAADERLPVADDELL